MSAAACSQDTDDPAGFIGREEVSVVLRQLGFRDDAGDQFGRLFDRMDVDGSGLVGFREFACAVVSPGTADADDAMRLTPAARERIFRFFDEDGSGVIDEPEMLAKLVGLGFDTSGVGDLFREMGGRDRRGVAGSSVTRRQFMRYLERLEDE